MQDDQPGKDARRVDPRLRPPVEDIELEFDPRTGMANYIANEDGHWDTSARLVRERIVQCIEWGRRARSGGGERELYEAYRLCVVARPHFPPLSSTRSMELTIERVWPRANSLGTLLHTLEDFSAHSNWCELSLLRLGYTQVFCHVGDAVRIQSPSGTCPPLVTGAFVFRGRTGKAKAEGLTTPGRACVRRFVRRRRLPPQSPRRSDRPHLGSVRVRPLESDGGRTLRLVLGRARLWLVLGLVLVRRAPQDAL